MHIYNMVLTTVELYEIECEIMWVMHLIHTIYYHSQSLQNKKLVKLSINPFIIIPIHNAPTTLKTFLS